MGLQAGAYTVQLMEGSVPVGYKAVGQTHLDFVLAPASRIAGATFRIERKVPVVIFSDPAP